VRRAFGVLAQIVAATTGIAAIGGLVGFLIVHFGRWGGAPKGLSLGMIVSGALVFLIAGTSGSPSGQRPFGFAPPARSAAWVPASAPRNWLQVAAAGLGAIAAGVGVIALFGFGR